MRHIKLLVILFTIAYGGSAWSNSSTLEGDPISKEKTIGGIVGLFSAVEDAKGFNKAIKASLEASQKIVASSKNSISQLNKSMAKLDVLIGNQQFGKSIKIFDKSVKGKKAVATMTQTIRKLGLSKVDDYLELNKMSKKLSKASLEIKKLTPKSVKNIPIVGKIPLVNKIKAITPSSTVNNLKPTGVSKLGKTAGKVGKVAGPVLLMADITVDLFKAKDRIEKGSTASLEGLNIALKITESLIPSIPFAKTPSDVGRAMIDLKSALISRNSSLLKGNEIVNETSSSFINGEASLSAYLVRAIQKESTQEEIRRVGIKRAYLDIRKEYMENHFSSYYTSLHDTKKFLLQEKDAAWFKDSKAMFTSLIAGVTAAEQSMYNEAGRIWQNNQGLDIFKAYNDVIVAEDQLRSNVALLSQEDAKMNKQMANLSNSLESFSIQAEQLTVAPDTLIAVKVKESDSLIVREGKIDQEKVFLSGTRSEPCYVCDTNLVNSITSVNQGSNSTIGASSQYASGDGQVSNTPSNYKQLTGKEQAALSTNSTEYSSSGWALVSGDETRHISSGTSFGSVSLADNSVITALNNAGVESTVMQQTITLPTGVRQVTVDMMANFVTNEYPDFVGSEFNDSALIEVRTGSGNVYQATLFDKQLNSSNFTDVTNLPSPMVSEGGQTGFESIKQVIPVANGGQLQIRVTTTNVGDIKMPSATLVNGTTVK